MEGKSFMQFFEKEIFIPKEKNHQSLLLHIRKAVSDSLGKEGLLPVRLAITDSLGPKYKCEIAVLNTKHLVGFKETDQFFRFKKRPYENTKKFNTVFLVPTGIGAEIGGHAGDATPVARLLASASDTLITHPNVLNGADINEMPENSLYVEGSSICRLMMGTIGLKPVRANKILAVIDTSKHAIFENAVVNSINSARATMGIDCPEIVKLSPSISMTSKYSSSKRAVGVIKDIDNIFSVLKQHEKSYDAVAISSVIKVPENYHKDYFLNAGDMVNPWGGVEAMLTHAISYKFNIPSAHSPMLESPEIAHTDHGVVDARMSAEAVSIAFFHCVLKGLHKSPKLITDQNILYSSDIISAKDISCLIIPEGCLGLPTLSALEQGIKVISVRENKNLMKNNLTDLPWNKGQFFQAENYLEAVGIMNALKSGVTPASVRRPLKTLQVSVESNLAKKCATTTAPHHLSLYKAKPEQKTSTQEGIKKLQKKQDHKIKRNNIMGIGS